MNPQEQTERPLAERVADAWQAHHDDQTPMDVFGQSGLPKTFRGKVVGGMAEWLVAQFPELERASWTTVLQMTRACAERARGLKRAKSAVEAARFEPGSEC